MKYRALTFLLVISIGLPPSLLADTCSVSGTAFQAMPITDFLPGQLYLGAFPGLLYDGSNDPPASHDSDGRTFAARIKPSKQKKAVFLSIGFSNNTIEFCGGASFAGPSGDTDDPVASLCANNTALPLTFVQCPNQPCPYNQVESFLGQAFTDTSKLVRQDGSIVLVDGAKGSEVLSHWDPTSFGCSCTTQFDRIRDTILTPSGLRESQVESIWMKNADSNPTVSLSPSNPNDPNADANIAERHMGNIMRYLQTRYPNLQQVFLSPRIYAGYANLAGNLLNPEPFAYEIGFAIKHLIHSQIQEQQGAQGDSFAGNLTYNVSEGKRSVAPWIGWGPYLWASGATARKDGLQWLLTDYRYHFDPPSRQVNECTHPSTFGEQKAGTLILNFMKQSNYTAWFRVVH